MSDDAIPSSRFDEHCRALGRLCIAWAVLDRKVTDLASVLVARGPEVAVCLWTGAESMKPRCEAIKKLIFVRYPTIDQEWEKRLMALVDRIQTDLGPLRNRYVHDEWFVREEDVTRIRWRGRVQKPQSRQRARFLYAERHFESTAHVEALIADIEKMTDIITLVVITVSNGLLLDQPPEPFWL